MPAPKCQVCGEDIIVSLCVRCRETMQVRATGHDTCKGCGEPITFMKTKTGKIAPFTSTGVNHFIDCPAADKFRRNRYVRK